MWRWRCFCVLYLSGGLRVGDAYSCRAGGDRVAGGGLCASGLREVAGLDVTVFFRWYLDLLLAMPLSSVCTGSAGMSGTAGASSSWAACCAFCRCERYRDTLRVTSAIMIIVSFVIGPCRYARCGNGMSQSQGGCAALIARTRRSTICEEIKGASLNMRSIMRVIVRKGVYVQKEY